MAKKIELNPEFVKALELMEAGENVFVTGKAGTGKSTLLQYFRETTKKDIVVLAPTGVAAVNIHGQTIHSFFGFKPDITAEKVKEEYKNRGRRGLFKKLNAIVIDEISMVRADLLDCVDQFLKIHGKNKNKPFGGIQMIFIGDLYQLPPVVTGAERQVFRTFYETPYFFSAQVMSQVDFEIVELEKIYRQQDEDFIQILNSVRNRSIDDNLLSALNTRLQPEFSPTEEEFYIYLTTTNANANSVNQQKLSQLDEDLYQFEAKITGNFEEKSAPAGVVLEVKIGAQVMLVNNDREGRWVNGTVGKIVDIEDSDEGEVIWVELAAGETVDVTPYTWEMLNFVYNQSSKRLESETIGTFTQYPLILAWAITIHKSQGKTFEKVIVDMDRGAFAHGQTYVALSRCVSLEGVILKKPIKKSHILLDWKVVKFLTQFQYQKSDRQMSLDDKVKLIEKAIEEKSKLEITYLKSNDTKSKRLLEPNEVGTMEYLDKEFLGVSGLDHLRGEERVFRVDRILEMRIRG